MKVEIRMTGKWTVFIELFSNLMDKALSNLPLIHHFTDQSCHASVSVLVKDTNMWTNLRLIRLRTCSLSLPSEISLLIFLFCLQEMVV